MKTAIHPFLAVIIAGTTMTHATIVSHWKFDESSGTTAADNVGAFGGTLSGGAVFVSGGISGNAVSLATISNSLVNMGTSFPGFTSGDFSLSMWVNTTTTANDSLIVSKHESGFQNGYFTVVNQTGGGGLAGKATFTVGSEPVSQSPTSTTSVNDGLWHQIVGVFVAGGGHFIYVDGSPSEAGTVSQSVPANSAPFLIGGVNVSSVPTARYTGLVDDVQVYNNALSSSDVQYLYDHPGQAVPEPASALLLLGGAAMFFSARTRRPMA